MDAMLVELLAVNAVAQWKDVRACELVSDGKMAS